MNHRISKPFLATVASLLLLTLLFWLADSPFSHAQTDPVFAGAGDIATCSADHDEMTANLLDTITGTVFNLGDSVYEDASLQDFNDCYGPSWGRHKARTKPVPGNHDYVASGASGYFTYFGAAASPQDAPCTSNCQGYYSYDLGAWHIIALNSEIDVRAGSAQEKWLRADLAAHANLCTLAYWHVPLFSSGEPGNTTSMKAFWNDLYAYGADLVLNGHAHDYERFALQDPNGQVDTQHGIRQFVAGTGGGDLGTFPSAGQNVEARDNTTWGVLKLTLHATGYEWNFIPAAGGSFEDSGSGNCVTAQTPTATSTPTQSPTATATSTATSTPTDPPTPTNTPTPTKSPTAATPTPSSTPTATRIPAPLSSRHYLPQVIAP